MPEMSIPRHVGIIPDGNRRWARQRGLPTLLGHKKGFDVAVEIAREARKLGIHTLTLWGFSTENWNRSNEEKSYLFELYINMTDRYLKEALKEDVKIVHLGRKDRLPKNLIAKIVDAEEKTKNNQTYILNLALDYGGQDEILRSIERYVAAGRKGEFKDYLDTANQPHPYPDLIIRTSGEYRLSGFLLWQCAYSEFYFTNSHFPDFTPELFREALHNYSQRERRFGGK